MTVTADVIIPFHGQTPMLLRCLSALRTGARFEGSIFLVDDASSLEDRERAICAAEAMPQQVRLVSLPRCSGFVHAVNTAWPLCRSAVSVILNNDAVPAANVVHELTGAIERDPGLGAVSPGSDNRADLFQYREAPSDLPALSRAPYLTAMCLAIRRKAVCGLVFDPSFSPGYFEDLDLSCRLRLSGWKLAVLENRRVHHAGRSTFGLHSGLDRILARNYALFAARWSHLPDHAALTRRLGLAARGTRP